MGDWFKLGMGGIVCPLIWAFAFRLIRGGEQGTTDLEITDTGLSITNIPLSVTADVLTRAIKAQQRKPLPLAAGVIEGNPAVESNLVAKPVSALTEGSETVIDAETEDVESPAPDGAQS